MSNVKNARQRPARELSLDDDPLANLFGHSTASDPTSAGKGARHEQPHAPEAVPEQPLPAPTAVRLSSDSRDAPEHRSGARTEQDLTGAASGRGPIAAAPLGSPVRLAPPVEPSPVLKPDPTAARVAGKAVGHEEPSPSPAATARVAEGGNGLLVGGSAERRRIGTRAEPYERKRDGVRTRQISATLPSEMVQKIDHVCIDQNLDRSTLIMEAVHEYLATRRTRA